jgi:hypothetical protein
MARPDFQADPHPFRLNLQKSDLLSRRVQAPGLVGIVHVQRQDHRQQSCLFVDQPNSLRTAFFKVGKGLDVGVRPLSVLVVHGFEPVSVNEHAPIALNSHSKRSLFRARSQPNYIPSQQLLIPEIISQGPARPPPEHLVRLIELHIQHPAHCEIFVRRQRVLLQAGDRHHAG